MQLSKPVAGILVALAFAGAACGSSNAGTSGSKPAPTESSMMHASPKPSESSMMHASPKPSESSMMHESPTPKK